MQIDQILQPLDNIDALGGSCSWLDVVSARDEVRRRFEAALSTDAEPVATVAEMGVGGVRVLMPHPPGSTQHLPIGTKLYAEPVKTAPAVAVKALRTAIHNGLIDGARLESDLQSEFDRTVESILASVTAALSAQVQDVARPLSEYHEDYGFVTWWKFPVNEPSYIGSPLCDDWPGYHTHWTPHPAVPASPASKHGDAE